MCNKVKCAISMILRSILFYRFSHYHLVSVMWWYIVLVLAASASAAVKRNTDGERHQVIIVGAGVSGYTAAVTLLENNVTDVLVLEASDRIGGRIHTVQFGGVTLDKGAEFVHGEVDNAVFELVSPYDLLMSYAKLFDVEMFLVTNTSGHIFNSSIVKPLLDKSYEIFFEDVKNLTGSMSDYFYPRLDELFDENHVDPYLREAIRFLVPRLEETSSAADDLEVSGIREYSEYKVNDGDDTWTWKTKGYSTLFDILSKKFPNASEELPVNSKIVLNKKVTKIERKSGEGGVKVKCEDGSRYLADHVIVTTSLGVLKKHAATMFQPPLPADKTSLIEKLGFGCLGKVFILFETRWWPNTTNTIVPLFSNEELKDFQNNTLYGYWSSYTTGFNPVVKHDNMLCVWVSGEACRTMDTLSDQQVTDALMEFLDKLVGKTYNISRPEAILRSNWATYPFTLGSYSYRSVASDSLNLNYSILAQPILDDNGAPVILFAGEATHPFNFATVHGALTTGRREAQRLIDYHANKL